MSHLTLFPVRSTDNRCYRAGSAAGFAVVLVIVAGLAGYVGASHAMSSDAWTFQALAQAHPLADTGRTGHPT